MSRRTTEQRPVSEWEMARQAIRNRKRAEKRFGIRTWAYEAFFFWVCLSVGAICLLTSPIAAQEAEPAGWALFALGLVMVSTCHFASPFRAIISLTSSNLFLTHLHLPYPIPLGFLQSACCLELPNGQVWLGLKLSAKGTRMGLRLPFAWGMLNLFGKTIALSSLVSGDEYDFVIPMSEMDAKTGEVVDAINQAIVGLPEDKV